MREMHLFDLGTLSLRDHICQAYIRELVPGGEDGKWKLSVVTRAGGAEKVLHGVDGQRHFHTVDAAVKVLERVYYAGPINVMLHPMEAEPLTQPVEREAQVAAAARLAGQVEALRGQVAGIMARLGSQKV